MEICEHTDKQWLVKTLQTFIYISCIIHHKIQSISQDKESNSNSNLNADPKPCSQAKRLFSHPNNNTKLLHLSLRPSIDASPSPHTSYSKVSYPSHSPSTPCDQKSYPYIPISRFPLFLLFHPLPFPPHISHHNKIHIHAPIGNHKRLIHT